MNLSQLGAGLIDQALYTVNSLLWVVYWLEDHLPLLAAVAAGLVVLLVFDRWVQQDAHSRALRPDRAATGVQGVEMHVTQVLTLLALGLWVLAALGFQTPVPELGAAMWLGMVLLLALLPAEREAVQWRLKGLILGYALLLLAFRWYLGVVSTIDARDWAAALGSVDEAQRVLAQNKGIFETLGIWAAWFAVPFAFGSYAVQKVLANRLSLEAPFRRAETVIRAIRTRGEVS
ncbi:MAG: hypothetical protein KKA73_16235 [Chloroflexi bacterium]|nr:hypothetical protein [Chloroflexota bacterium]